MTSTAQDSQDRRCGEHRLEAREIEVGYDTHRVIEGLSVEIPPGEITVIVGPNACGKSTLLKTLSRMLIPKAGEVLLDGKALSVYDTKQIARILGLLPQSPVTPDAITVEDLVARGRYPHQSLMKQWSKKDAEMTRRAMQRANVADLAGREVAGLSGGQRQRVWLAMVLAQDTPLLLLDEPTTYLDITHQVEVLNLTRELHRQGITVVMVLHELMMAFRYATNLIVMKGGEILAQGKVEEVVTPELVSSVYDLPCRLVEDPETGRPIVVPLDGPSR